MRSPALHFLLVGGLCFGVWLLSGGGVSAPERERIVIPAHRVTQVLRQFVEEERRSATPEEYREILDELVDQEVLYRYALLIGMADEPVVQRRLAQIADFVEANPHEAESQSDRATKAMDLGLHHGDLIVRRILTDAAKRLIRAVVLVREPRQDALEDFLTSSGDTFARPTETRITHVHVNRLAYGKESEARALSHLERIEAERLSPEQAILLEKPAYVEPTLPLLTHQDVGRRFGFAFAKELDTLPVETWSGPISSRYGYHLVYVHEREPAHVPPLDEIRVEVQKRFLEHLADEWLALRLEEIRSEFEIILPVRS